VKKIRGKALRVEWVGWAETLGCESLLMRLISLAERDGKRRSKGDAVVNIQQGESLVGSQVLYVSIYLIHLV
jgi:hypothetical protein